QLAAEVDETLAAIRDRAQHLVARQPDERRDPGRYPRRVLDQERVREDGDGVFGDGQVQPLAFGDRPARGRDRYVLDLLRDGTVLQVGRLDGREPGRAAHRDGEESEEGSEQKPDAAV